MNQVSMSFFLDDIWTSSWPQDTDEKNWRTELMRFEVLSLLRYPVQTEVAPSDIPVWTGRCACASSTAPDQIWNLCRSHCLMALYRCQQTTTLSKAGLSYAFTEKTLLLPPSCLLPPVCYHLWRTELTGGHCVSLSHCNLDTAWSLY